MKRKNREEREQRVAEEVARGGSSEGVIQKGRYPKSETFEKPGVEKPEEEKWTPMRKEVAAAARCAGQRGFKSMMKSRHGGRIRSGRVDRRPGGEDRSAGRFVDGDSKMRVERGAGRLRDLKMRVDRRRKMGDVEMRVEGGEKVRADERGGEMRSGGHLRNRVEIRESPWRRTTMGRY